jgi:hypothetical protein
MHHSFGDDDSSTQRLVVFHPSRSLGVEETSMNMATNGCIDIAMHHTGHTPSVDRFGTTSLSSLPPCRQMHRIRHPSDATPTSNNTKVCLIDAANACSTRGWMVSRSVGRCPASVDALWWCMFLASFSLVSARIGLNIVDSSMT